MMLQDSSLALRIKDRIRSTWPDLPIQFFLTDDPKASLREFKDLTEQLRPLVIFNLPFPGGDPKNFIESIQKLNGATTIIALTNQMNVDLGLSLIKFKLPLVKWDELLQRIAEAIPEDLKNRFNIIKRNTLLLERLKNYSMKYSKTDHNKFVDIQTEPIVCISRFFDSHLQPQSIKTVRPEPELIKSQPASTDYKSIDNYKMDANAFDLIRKKVFKSEIFIIGLICCLTALMYLFFSEFSGSGLFSLKGFLTGLSFFSVFGFFAGRSLDRFLLAEQIKNLK